MCKVDRLRALGGNIGLAGRLSSDGSCGVGSRNLMPNSESHYEVTTFVKDRTAASDLGEVFDEW